MPALTKTISGLIYHNDFQSSTLDELLIVSPTDGYYSLLARNGYLRMNGSNGDTRILLDPIVKEYTIIAKVDYIPVGESSAGLILYKDETTYVEFKSYDSSIEDVGVIYTYLKIIRDSTSIAFFGSTDNLAWKLFGKIDVEAISLLVGFFCYGMVDLDIDSITIYKGHALTVTNIPENYRIRLYDENLVERYIDTPVNGNTAIFKLNNPFIGKLILVNEENTMVAQTSAGITLRDGDEYQFDINIEIYMETHNEITKAIEWIPITPLTTTDLGVFESITMERKLSIRNIDTVVINNLQVSIKPSGLYKKGYDMAGLTIPEENVITQGYSKLLENITLQPNDVFEFVMRVNRDGNSISSPDYVFNISVRAW